MLYNAGYFMAKGPWHHLWSMFTLVLQLNDHRSRFEQGSLEAVHFKDFRKVLADLGAAMVKGIDKTLLGEDTCEKINHTIQAIFDKMSAKNTSLLQLAVTEAQTNLRSAMKDLFRTCGGSKHKGVSWKQDLGGDASIEKIAEVAMEVGLVDCDIGDLQAKASKVKEAMVCVAKARGDAGMLGGW